MGFLNAVKIKTEEITRDAAKKACNLVETAKNSAAIVELNDKIKNLYKEIGEQVYTANETENDVPDLTEQFNAINECREKILFHQAEIERLKN